MDIARKASFQIICANLCESVRIRTSLAERTELMGKDHGGTYRVETRSTVHAMVHAYHRGSTLVIVVTKEENSLCTQKANSSKQQTASTSPVFFF